MKKLFRVFCLIGIVFFLGINEGYAEDSKKYYCENVGNGGECDTSSSQFGMTLHPVKDGTLPANEKKVMDAICDGDDILSFCEYKCTNYHSGLVNTCKIPAFSSGYPGGLIHELNVQKFYVGGFYFSSEYKNYDEYHKDKKNRIKQSLENGQCGEYGDCYNYLINKYCKDFGNSSSICSTMIEYTSEKKEEDIKNNKQICKINFKYDKCGVDNINAYFVYSDGNLTLKDIESYDKDSNKVDIKKYAEGKIQIDNYVNKYRSNDQCGSTSYYKDFRNLNYFHKKGDFKTFKTDFIKKLEESDNLECPSYVWCGERTSSGVENDFYLVLKDDLSMNNMDTCISKGYSEDATVIGFNEDGTLDQDKITVDDIKNFYIKEYGNFIDVNKPIDFANCEELLSNKNENAKDVINLLKFLVWAIRIIVPLLMIALGCLDFAKAVFSGEDNMKKAQSKFVKRVVISVVIMLIPSLLKFILTIAGGIWPDTISPDLCGIL